ncbi:MAG: indolepyruvate oxidoreductase subunit beta [Spirochaetes bacterium]|nr:indolepyruvate oxidoreductase subunit beta [Spirochaetota bacterium]NLJ05928.1 indolepyruvate oxidoreductase subunit beta [Exilispira sp.]HNV44433.1 indolepyruvate oxidoreductase subunit beta [Exilispira sp.]
MSNEIKNVLIVGVGGQGTILAAKILSEGLVFAGFDVKMSEIHGMAQRGGSVSTQIRYGEKVYSPLISEKTADVILSFEKIEAARWLNYLKPEGYLIINDYEILPVPVLIGSQTYPSDIDKKIKEKVKNCFVIDAFSEAKKLGNTKVQNTLLLAVVIKKLGLEKIDWETVLRSQLSEKIAELNIKAFQRGIQLA